MLDYPNIDKKKIKNYQYYINPEFEFTGGYKLIRKRDGVRIDIICNVEYFNTYVLEIDGHYYNYPMVSIIDDLYEKDYTTNNFNILDTIDED